MRRMSRRRNSELRGAWSFFILPKRDTFRGQPGQHRVARWCMKVFYGLLADVLVFIHFLYVLFAVGGLVFILLGAACKWKGVRNPIFRTVHLIAVGLVALEAATGVDCPLTVWEFDLRHLAGQAVEQNISFVARLVRLIIFYDLPHWVFTVLHIGFALLVIATYIVVPPRLRTSR